MPTNGREEAWLEVTGVIDVQCISLTQVFELASNNQAPSTTGRLCALLKIDTQGFDLAVLSSGEEVVNPQRVRAVLVEMNFECFYEGQGLAADTLTFMMDHGFAPAALYPPTRVLGPRPLPWADMLFLSR